MIKIYADPKSTVLMKEYLTSQGLSDLCTISQHEKSEINIICKDDKKTYTTPVRLGRVLDQILVYNQRILHENIQTQISFADGTLDVTHGIFFTDKDHKQTQLTEKEAEILTYLHTQKGKTVSRKDLLSAVWNYAEGVETHTLETHIYRLRQKIEKDTSNPQILITDGDGYYTP